MLEEVASPEHWKNRSTGFSCVSAACAAFVITSIIKVLEGNGTLNYSSIIVYRCGQAGVLPSSTSCVFGRSSLFSLQGLRR